MDEVLLRFPPASLPRALMPGDELSSCDSNRDWLRVAYTFDSSSFVDASWYRGISKSKSLELTLLPMLADILNDLAISLSLLFRSRSLYAYTARPHTAKGRMATKMRPQTPALFSDEPGGHQSSAPHL